MLLILGDREPPSDGVGGYAETWTSSVSQPAQWDTKLLRLSWLNLGSVLSSNTVTNLVGLAKEICTLTLRTEYPTQEA